MKSILALMCVTLAAGAARAAPRLGEWGEDLDKAPDFGYPQERRAPKLPANRQRFWATPPLTVERIDDALLICHVQVSHEQPWDVFAGPDTLLQFTFRDEHLIGLWGPEDHWDFFVSIPRIALARGDSLGVKMWDRDLRSMDWIGEGHIAFDGRFPMKMHGGYFEMECRAVPHARVLGRCALNSGDRPHPRRGGAQAGSPSLGVGRLRGGARSPDRSLGEPEPALCGGIRRMGFSARPGAHREDARRRGGVACRDPPRRRRGRGAIARSGRARGHRRRPARARRRRRVRPE